MSLDPLEHTLALIYGLQATICGFEKSPSTFQESLSVGRPTMACTVELTILRARDDVRAEDRTTTIAFSWITWSMEPTMPMQLG